MSFRGKVGEGNEIIIASYRAGKHNDKYSERLGSLTAAGPNMYSLTT